MTVSVNSEFNSTNHKLEAQEHNARNLLLNQPKEILNYIFIFLAEKVPSVSLLQFELVCEKFLEIIRSVKRDNKLWAKYLAPENLESSQSQEPGSYFKLFKNCLWLRREEYMPKDYLSRSKIEEEREGLLAAQENGMDTGEFEKLMKKNRKRLERFEQKYQITKSKSSPNYYVGGRGNF